MIEDMAGRNLRCLFLGDSFTQGVGDPEFRGWVGRVAADCWAGPGAGAAEVTVFNLGVRRNTSADVRARCWGETDVRVLPGADNRLVLSVGSNDAVEEAGRPRVEPDACLANVAALLDGARGRGLVPFVVGPPPVVDAGAPHLGRLLSLAEGIAGVCAARGVPFVDVTAALAADRTWVAEALAADGAHPGAGGYRRLADLVLGGGFREWSAERGRGPGLPGRA
ncbi:Lysophospholipase L1 [Streptomyces sp. TLI_053]|uniref:GDSL-type esterase/lipase family protein n=1 Tax=Streptomyces sp. TLI_053 TaxID=1855352 RepID=UPI00087D43AD|nr:GDSL-type esterase/lipase family protein [Streptomyces sp. TLI_053]SDT79077.1 Lysophospholipase L1 [Streptomyces sp. TLI_053]